ncbi:MAG: T9SS type A sorting domain-containing protein [Bacteroidetes bacterium]|nr:T9SS type A sorting domain-containing protein [Bacteroidota bacterium]
MSFSGFDATIAQLDTIIVVTPVSGLNENHQQATLVLTPNPATDHLTIDGLPVNSKIQISDLTGKIVIEAMTRNKNTLLDISKLPEGVYFLQTENGVKKIVKM